MFHFFIHPKSKWKNRRLDRAYTYQIEQIFHGPTRFVTLRSLNGLDRQSVPMVGTMGQFS